MIEPMKKKRCFQLKGTKNKEVTDLPPIPLMTVVFLHIAGLSLDHQTLSAVSRIRLSEREEESLTCFLKACDAAMSYLQELDKVGLHICKVQMTCMFT